MRFSVIIPAHNVQHYIEDAVHSVLKQSLRDYELLVVADSCTDGTVDTVRGLGVQPIEVSMKSAGLARNVGLDRASGDYVLFLDGDDYYICASVFAVIDRTLRRSLEPDVLHFGFMHGRRPCGTMSNKGGLWPNVWSRAWKRSAIAGCRFNDQAFGEDLSFCEEVWSREGLRHVRLEELLVQYRFPRVGSLTWKHLSALG